MLAAFVMTVAAQAGVLGLSADDRVTARVAAERVAKCDVGTVTVKSDTELDLDTLVVTGSAPVSDRQLACIDEAAGYYEVALQPSVQPRFENIREARQAALAATEARSWLKARGLLDRLPD